MIIRRSPMDYSEVKAYKQNKKARKDAVYNGAITGISAWGIQESLSKNKIKNLNAPKIPDFIKNTTRKNALSASIIGLGVAITTFLFKKAD